MELGGAILPLAPLAGLIPAPDGGLYPFADGGRPPKSLIYLAFPRLEEFYLFFFFFQAPPDVDEGQCNGRATNT